jgi:VanZ family protein
MLPLQRRRAWLAGSTLLVLLVVVASLAPSGTVPMPPVSGFDKVEHFVAYAVLAAWFAGLYPRASYPWIALGLATLGFVIEVLQQYMGLGREGDPRDMLADLAGIAVGLWLGGAVAGDWALRVESWLARR